MTDTAHSTDGSSASARERREAGEIAAQLIEPHMRVGLGSGATVEAFLPALARRRLSGLRCVATSSRRSGSQPSSALKWSHSLTSSGSTSQLTGLIRSHRGWGGSSKVATAHTCERRLLRRPRRGLWSSPPQKLVDRLAPPIPVEILSFGVRSTLNILRSARIREGAPPTADHGILADLFGDFDDPAVLAARLDSTPGVIGHGLFGLDLVHDFVIPGRGHAGLRVKR